MRTPVCDLLGIDVPIVSGAFGPWDSVALAAAVGDAGGLGSLGTAVRPLADLEAQWHRLRGLISAPFAINHTMRPFDEDVFAASLRFRPAAISFHMGVPADLIDRTHQAGILWIQQVVDAAEAELAVQHGADVIIAQGGEAGGHAGVIGTMVIVPAVVDMAGEIPVLAAGGIVDGRGLAAALCLGAQGVVMGTRFLATQEMAISSSWKERIVSAGPDAAVKVTNAEVVLPPFSRPVEHIEPRSLPTPLVARLARAPETVDAAALLPDILEAILDGGGDEYLPFAGQSAGLIDAVRPVGEIMAETVATAGALLRDLGRIGPPTG